MTFLGAVDFAAIPNASKLRKAKKVAQFLFKLVNIWGNRFSEKFLIIKDKNKHVLKIFISKFFRYLRGADKITMQ
jgi:hypothetical protein